MHEGYSLARETLYLVKFSCLDKRILDHEAAAACNYLREFQICEDICSVDAARGHEFQLAVRCGNSLEHSEAAGSFGREELDHIKSQLHSLLHFTAGRTAGNYGITVCNAVLYDSRIESGADDEFGTCPDGAVCLLGCENRARADEHIGISLCHACDGFCRSICTEGNFRERKSACDERLCQRLGIIGIFYFYYGNYAEKPYFFQDIIHFESSSE